MRQDDEGAALAREEIAEVIVLVGPTASGKTELAAALAVELGGEVVSADSRQVYRFLDAATAKPSSELRARVPHWLIDVADPAEAYDAARFAAEASAAVNAIRARGKTPIVCGGTGLYIRALLEGLSPLPPRDPAVRARLEALAASDGPRALHARLAKADPVAAAAIPAANLQRVMRALEVLELTGKTLAENWAAGRTGGVKASAVLRLEVSAPVLRERIERRARAVWPGLLAEVSALVPSRFKGDEPGFSSLGYRQAQSVLAGELSEAKGLAEMVRVTNAYAKRQRTWFKTQLEARSIDAGAAPDQILEHARKTLEENREATTTV